MTYQATGYVRDYDAPSDTCTVELIGIGIIDTWLDGCRINAGVNRGYLTHGAEVLLAIPDAHRLCEASIVSINGSGAVLANSGGAQKFQTGRVRIPTDGTGAGTITVIFPSAFTVIPQLYAGADELLPLHVGTPTLTQFTLSFSAGTAPANSNIYCTWFALGGA
jgi:hypothetical protein